MAPGRTGKSSSLPDVPDSETQARDMKPMMAASHGLNQAGKLLKYMYFSVWLIGRTQCHVYPIMNCTAPLMPGFLFPMEAFDRW